MSLSTKSASNGRLIKPKHSLQPSPARTKSLTPHLQSLSFQDDQLSPAELAEILARRAYTLAQEPPAAVTGQTMALLIFRLNNERYGIDVTNVHEIYPLQQLTPVPRTPPFVAGVFSARGRILSVIDLRTFLGLPAAARGQTEVGQSKIMVVTNTDSTSETVQMEVGLLVDEVIDVQTIFTEELEASLTTPTGSRANHIRGVTSDLLVVLELNALLGDKQLIIKDEL